MTCAPSEDSDQPVRFMGKQGPIVSAVDNIDSDQLGRWPGWSGSSLGIYAILLVLSCSGLFSETEKSETVVNGIVDDIIHKALSGKRCHWSFYLLKINLFVLKSSLIAKPSYNFLFKARQIVNK